MRSPAPFATAAACANADRVAMSRAAERMVGHVPWKNDCVGVGEVDAVKCAAGKAAFGDGYGPDA